MYDITTPEGLVEAAMCEVMGYGEVPLIVDEDDNVYRMEDIQDIIAEEKWLSKFPSAKE